MLRKFARYLPDITQQQRRMIRRRLHRILGDNTGYIEDQNSQSHLIACALVLAAYRQLRAQNVAKGAATEQLGHALRQPGGRTMRWIMCLSLWLPRNPRDMIRYQTRKRTEMVYGLKFDLVSEDRADVFTSIVWRCGYHDFFMQNQAPELTSVFCAWDSLWSDEVNRSGVARFRRPVNIATGGQSCRFEFHFDAPAQNTENPR